MIIEAKQNNKITISFSASVGNKGIKRITNYIEFLEMGSGIGTTVSQSSIKNLADDITSAAWQKMKKKKQS